jgi:regulator of replication initiation timing
MDKMRLQAESFENLGALYTSGYHVCPVSFGARRDGECIFCVALLEKR